MEFQTTNTVDHLFRRESAKLVTVLTRLLGPHNLELAEDVVQDALLKAMETWKYQGLPQNPTAWLFTVARNRALDIIQKEKNSRKFSKDLDALLRTGYSAKETVAKNFDEDSLPDEQLNMMFVCCHPAIPEESQLALILKTLGGFGIKEIASAFVTNDETIAKRLYRGRKTLESLNIDFTLPVDGELELRSDQVLKSIYLIFNEGYHASVGGNIIREDLIEESMRLAFIFNSIDRIATPTSLALMALMCFQSSRVLGRLDEHGELLTLERQNRALWNKELIEIGKQYLRRSSRGTILSAYHLEAMIAYEHCNAPSYQLTQWDRILTYYDMLVDRYPGLPVQLNRIVALAEVRGAEAALRELDAIKAEATGWAMFSMIRAELLVRLNRKSEAIEMLDQASLQTNSESEKRFLERKKNDIMR